MYKKPKIKSSGHIRMDSKNRNDSIDNDDITNWNKASKEIVFNKPVIYGKAINNPSKYVNCKVTNEIINETKDELRKNTEEQVLNSLNYHDLSKANEENKKS